MKELFINKLVLKKYCLENINEDFDVFEVSTDNPKLLSQNILDIKSEDPQFNARSVVYAFGKKAFMLFDKGTTTVEQILNEYKKIDIDNAYVNQCDLFDKKYRARNFYAKDRLLIQLLINTLTNASDTEDQYNNLTGKFYYTSPIWTRVNDYTIRVLELSLKPGLVLFPDLITMKKSPYRYHNKDNTAYFFDDNNGKLRRVNKGDNISPETPVFFKEGWKGSHGSMDFLGLTKNTYESSKGYAIYQLKKDINQKLNKYLEVEFARVQAQSHLGFLKEDHSFNLSDYLYIFQQYEVRFEDTIKDEESSECIEELKKCFSSWWNISSRRGKVSDSKFNVVLIHDTRKQTGIDYDIHQVDYGEAVVNHITIESLRKIAKKSQPEKELKRLLEVVLTEMLIKMDIQRRKITLFDWTSLHFDDPVTFTIRTSVNKGTDNYNQYCFCMTVNPDGTFSYEYFLMPPIGELPLHGFKNDMCESLKSMKADKSGKYYNHDIDLGIVIGSSENLFGSSVFQIKKTAKRSLPDIEGLYDEFKKINDNAIIKKEDIEYAIHDMLIDNEGNVSCARYCNNMHDSLDGLHSNIKVKDIGKILNWKSPWGRTAADYLLESTGILTHVIAKSVRDDRFSFENVVGINYYKTPIDDDYIPNSWCYFVGKQDYSSIKGSIDKSCVIREIYSKGINPPDEDFIKQCLSMVKVGFVRKNNYPVLPFPYKYLQEIKRLYEIKEPLKFGKLKAPTE